MPDALCPECHAAVTLEAVAGLGQRAECPACRAALEVVKVRPLELDWHFEEPLPQAVRVEETAT